LVQDIDIGFIKAFFLAREDIFATLEWKDTREDTNHTLSKKEKNVVQKQRGAHQDILGGLARWVDEFQSCFEFRGRTRTGQGSRLISGGGSRALCIF
jgi:hypothetical protein